MWQEIVANEEAQEHKVVDQSLQIKDKWKLQIFELQVEVLAYDGELDELEFGDSGQARCVLRVAGTTLVLDVAYLAALEALAVFRRLNTLSQNVEMGLVGSQS